MIISIKLFPALLFIFVLHQKRYSVFFIMLLTCLLAFLAPLLSKGPESYLLYFNLLPRILWYGDNWNASLYGFLFRLFIDPMGNPNLWPIKITFILISIVLVFWYTKKLNQFRGESEDHRSFCLTLVMMLLMSPFGWLYYFSLLIMPLTLIGLSLRREDLYLWSLCLFLINFPSGYIFAGDMGGLIYKVSYYSIYFYGLVIALILTSRLKPQINVDKEFNDSALYPLKISLAISLLTVVFSSILHVLVEM